MTPNLFQNAHLDGDSFFWQAGATGALLIHGYTATTAEVRLLGEYLHARGYTVSAPLLPGHGTTPEEMNRCRWQDWTGAVVGAYQQLAGRCERVFVAGESMGALLTLFLASEHPEIAGIVVYAPALQIANRSSAVLARFMYRFVPTIKKAAGQPSAADARWKGYTVNPVAALVQMLELQKKVRAQLPRIRQPILACQGRLDKSVDLGNCDVILANVGSTVKEMHWFERSTHCVIIDCEWEEAARLTDEFFSQCFPVANATVPHETA